MSESVRFSETIAVRMPPALADLVSRAARARNSKVGEWARQALATALRLDGFDTTQNYTSEPDANPEPSVSQREASEA